MHWLRFILRVDLGLIAVISLAMLQCALAQEETSRLSDSTVFLIIDTTDNSGAQSTITGSGVIISPQGHVLTSAHNLPDLVDPTGYRSVRIRGVVGTKFGYPVDLERTGMASKDVDVAILKFRSIHGVSLRAAAVPVGDDLKQGDIVTILGFPIGLDLNVTRGTVTSVNGPSGRLVTDTQVAEGSSGGPAYDAFGRLIGIVSSGFRDDNTGQLVGLNLLVPIAAAKSVAAGLSWITASSTGNLECKGRRLEIVGEGLVPNEGAMDPLSREIKPNELSGVLSSRYPWLVINGGKVVLSSLGEQVLLRFCRLELRSGARMIVGRSRVSILANQIVSENGAIVAFENTAAPLPPPPTLAGGQSGKSGDPGMSAGSVLLAILGQLDGNLYVRLDGTHGASGGAGGPGTPGADGPPGRGGSDSLFDCKRGPADGGRGLAGSPGGPGGAGGVGGNAGDLTVVKLSTSRIPENAISFSGRPGAGGAGGAGGPGGPGGEGGKSGNETFYCKGGRDGPQGPSGPSGANGVPAADGQEGAISFTPVNERAIIDLF